MTFTYTYPRPSVTVDAVIFCVGHVLLIKRRDEPFKDCWALPGGFMNIDESLLTACLREVKEETNLDLDTRMQMVGVFDGPHRDTRGRVITVAYSTIIPLRKCGEVKAGDDAAEFQWFQKESLPPLAFDHAAIIKQAIDQRTKK